VLDVRVGGVSFLLTGDITRAVEPEVLSRLAPAECLVAEQDAVRLADPLRAAAPAAVLTPRPDWTSRSASTT
jgi:hypothetical protein